MGWTVVEALPELGGRPWCEITRAYVSALRPSEIRVVLVGDCVKLDSVTWRVTVRVDDAGRIFRVEQEVEVQLPEGVRHGHDLATRLGRL